MIAGGQAQNLDSPPGLWVLELILVRVAGGLNPTPPTSTNTINPKFYVPQGRCAELLATAKHSVIVGS